MVTLGRDPIVAWATPPGNGAIGIVRLSGAGCFTLAEQVVGTLPPERRASVRSFHDPAGALIDTGVVIRYQGPRSFTGEDLIEFQGHGSAVAIAHLIETLTHYGARLARPGEFSERAFLNGRLDLAQAEAIADLITAESREAASAALRSLTGQFSEALRALKSELEHLEVEIEAAIDFSGEDVPESEGQARIGRLASLHHEVEALLARGQAGLALRRGYVVILTGPVNAGKSTLFNRFLGEPRAIVTPHPGTTRDWLEAEWVLEGLRIHVIDTAGLRESDDPVEQEGIRRTQSVLTRAHLILYIIDDAQGWQVSDDARFAALPSGITAWKIYNQIDRTGRAPGRVSPEAYAISAATESGLSELTSAIAAQGQPVATTAGDSILARRRHLDALERCRDALESALRLDHGGAMLELVAEELRRARGALGEILGERSTEELLGAIFSTFCIGK